MDGDDIPVPEFVRGDEMAVYIERDAVNNPRTRVPITDLFISPSQQRPTDIKDWVELGYPYQHLSPGSESMHEQICSQNRTKTSKAAEIVFQVEHPVGRYS